MTLSIINDPDFHGWLDLNLQLASTNYNTAGHAQAYRIVAGMIVNGGFVNAWPGLRGRFRRRPEAPWRRHGYRSLRRIRPVFTNVK
ncbi:hypothetical protein [Paraburkholderia xenovorans]|uniref:hypothetical protein n=1 Tax=Paraburkholderia xenovorans TaxID=36873 RepID=UPI0019FADE1A|nr:hypothetical protein [Paraburkholderia xenovorans]NPT35678.1 hypothetical protein [Paraburkholderia xenovorans]